MIYVKIFLELDLVSRPCQRWNVEFNMIQIIGTIVTFTKIVISYFAHLKMCHTFHLSTSIDLH
jgi:hypothetical protein